MKLTEAESCFQGQLVLSSKVLLEDVPDKLVVV